MRKMTAVFLAMLLLVSLAACDTVEPDASSSTPTPSLNSEPVTTTSVTSATGERQTTSRKQNITETSKTTTTTTTAAPKPTWETPMTNYKSNNYTDCITYRTPLTNTYNKLTKGKELTVVYFGGSLTNGYGCTDYCWKIGR
jgi:hypothetical protein